jgi:PAS domain S-box-containing protein
VNGILAVVDLVAFVGFFGAFLLLLRLRPAVLPDASRLFLGVCLLLYTFVGLSNTVRGDGTTAVPKLPEAYALALFIPCFLFFLYSLALAREGEEGRRCAGELSRALEERDAERERLAVTLSLVGDGVVVAGPDGRVLHLNPAAERLTGWSDGDGKGRPVEEVCRLFDERSGEELPNPLAPLMRGGEEGAAALPERLVVVSLGAGRTVAAPAAAPVRRDGANEGAVLALGDLTLRRELEAARALGGKAESADVLAGGIAHEFNNILTGLLGSISMARIHSGTPEGDGYLESAERAGRRGCGLTMQLLSFARGGSPVKRHVRPEEVVGDALGFTLHGTAVRLELFAQEALWTCEMDEGQVGQALNGLALHAVEAMPEGGTLHASLVNAYLVEGNRAALPPGPYVLLRLSDEGKGIPSNLFGRLFEPTFVSGRGGDAIGLSSVHSIVSNHGGAIVVDSKEGKGTTFSAWFPASPDREAGERAPTALPVPRGAGRILVMDDDEDVRAVAGQMLRHLGYEPDFAREGGAAAAAYRAARAAGRPFSAVLMDLTVRAGMGGEMAAREILDDDPEAKVIVSSGYSGDPVVTDYGRHGFVGSVVKPYRVEQLASELARLGL